MGRLRDFDYARAELLVVLAVGEEREHFSIGRSITTDAPNRSAMVASLSSKLGAVVADHLTRRVTGHQPDECDNRVRLARATYPGEQPTRRAMAEAPRPFAARVKRSRARFFRCRIASPGIEPRGSSRSLSGRRDSTSPYGRRFAARHLRRKCEGGAPLAGRRRRAQLPGRPASDVERRANNIGDRKPAARASPRRVSR